MTIEQYKLDLMKAAFHEKVVAHMTKNEISKSFDVGAKGSNAFIGAWEIEYSMPSIFQKNHMTSNVVLNIVVKTVKPAPTRFLIIFSCFQQ